MAEGPGPARLTDLLVAPAPAINPEAWRAATAWSAEALSGLAAGGAGGGPRRLTEYQVRRALSSGDPWPETPFAWSARTTRRALGLHAVRLLVAGRVRNPTDGVRAALAEATRGAGDGRRPRCAMDRWLSGLPPAGRAAVGAEAVTWSTRLWCALDWEALDGPVVIGRDHWWDGPRSSLLALRSRAEVRTASAHLVVLSGSRRSSVRSELSVVALVEALRSREGYVPGRIVGWWPDSGHLVRVEVEPAVLSEGVAAVETTLRGRQGRAAA
ncbi:MAG TPA: hypothetical protein VND70_09965 [Acidimicrobiales bacterium]|nr:hypothetical protein [Acidimicrobiales bacterium]